MRIFFPQRSVGRRVLGAETIYIGAVAQRQLPATPTVRPEYYDAFNQIIRVGTKEGCIGSRLRSSHFARQEIIRRGLELGAPLELTWSFTLNSAKPCGVCDSCVLRLRAFEAAGVKDPLPYAARVAAHS